MAEETGKTTLDLAALKALRAKAAAEEPWVFTHDVLGEKYAAYLHALTNAAEALIQAAEERDAAKRHMFVWCPCGKCTKERQADADAERRMREELW